MKITDRCSENRMNCLSIVLRERVTQIQAVHSFCPLPCAHKGDSNKYIMHWRVAKTQLRATNPQTGPAVWEWALGKFDSTQGSLQASPTQKKLKFWPWSFCLLGMLGPEPEFMCIIYRTIDSLRRVWLSFLQPLHC